MLSDLDILVAKEAIRELSHRYFLYADTNNFGAISELFADECVFDESCLGFPIKFSRASVRDFYESDTPGTLAFAAHFVTNEILTVLDADRAEGTIYVLFEGGLIDGSRVKLLAYFEDTFVREHGHWLFKSRKLTPFTEPEGFDRVSELAS